MSTLAIHPSATRPALRLTRRGRIVVFLAATALVLVTAVFLGAASVATDQAVGPTETRVIMVDDGDTLWTIASDIAATGEVRDMIDTIKQLNALDSAAIQAGQELHVPA